MMMQSEKDRFHILLMGAIDGELSENENREFEQFINNTPEYQKEFKQYKKLKEVTTHMRPKSPPVEVWDTYWMMVYNKIERGIGWLLFTIGSVILLTYGGFKLVESVVSNPDLLWIVKGGILLLMGGLSVLLVSVIRERMFTYKKDPYKEVIR
ncbi:MAG: hypothetical protein GWP06_14885 [Actinobacteria bacterium]|nr:hypothetical protein [Actinomycetota bacterium]